MPEQLETMLKRFMQAFDDPESQELDELLAPDFVMHNPEGPDLHGPGQIRELIAHLRQVFPDLEFEVDDIVIGPDRVVGRWTCRGTHSGEFLGIQPTGKRVEFQGVEIARVENGKFVEDWVIWDALGLLQQVGLLPAMSSTLSGLHGLSSGASNRLRSAGAALSPV